MGVTRGICAEGDNKKDGETEEKKQSLGEIALTGFDTDKDGKISLHEILDQVNKNKDGANHPDLQGWTEGFKQADADKDMHLNAEELEYLFTHAKKEHKDELTSAIEDSTKSVMESFDTDKDGKISLMEFTERMNTKPEIANQPQFQGWNKGFKDADVDKDMHLNADELKSLLAKVMNEEHKEHPLHDEV